MMHQQIDVQQQTDRDLEMSVSICSAEGKLYFTGMADVQGVVRGNPVYGTRAGRRYFSVAVWAGDSPHDGSSSLIN